MIRIWSPVGALHMTLSRDGWQHEIAKLARKAKSLFMVMGTTPGFQWELHEFSSNSASRDKMTLLMPPENADGVRLRWNACFGGLTEIPENLMARVIAVRFLNDGSVIIIIHASEQSAAAYRMALNVSHA